MLQHKDEHVNLFLKDEDMGIVKEAFNDEGGTFVLDPVDRSCDCQRFKLRLAQGLDRISITVLEWILSVA